MTYIVCTRNKSKPMKAVAICAKCKFSNKCKDYQEYKTKREKEVIKLNEENKNIPMFPAEAFQQVMSAPSKGKFFYSAIRGKYEFLKIETSKED